VGRHEREGPGYCRCEQVPGWHVPSPSSDFAVLDFRCSTAREFKPPPKKLEWDFMRLLEWIICGCAALLLVAGAQAGHLVADINAIPTASGAQLSGTALVFRHSARLLCRCSTAFCISREPRPRILRDCRARTEPLPGRRCLVDRNAVPGPTNAQKEQLDRRLVDHADNPEDVVPRDEVKDSALTRMGR
jgi:hypothetical protein